MTDKPTIIEALSAVMAKVQGVRKGSRNLQQGYTFRGIDAVVNAVGPALRESGVIVVPLVETVDYATVEVGQKRTPMRECTVRVRYRFHGPAGDTLECVSVGEAMDSGDKSTPKAMSVAFRVALLQALCIPTDEQEADVHSYERAPEKVWPAHTADQRLAAELFTMNIGKASTTEELDTIGKSIAAASREGGISRTQLDMLVEVGRSRRSELVGEVTVE